MKTPGREESASRPGVVFGPLHRVRVLDLAGRAGDLCGRLLADAGADVIKVEPPDGNSARQRPPFIADTPDRERSLTFLHYNAGKRGITLDYSKPAGRELFLRLVGRADILVEDAGEDSLARCGIGHSALMKANPGLAHVSITQFGLSGPYRNYAANDFICFALGGLMAISGEPGMPPIVAPGELAYAVASGYAALGGLIAYYNCALTGEGQLVDVSIHEAAAFTAGYAVPVYTATGEKPFRQSWKKRLFDLYDVYPTKDGFIRIFIMPKKHWQSLLDWLGRPPELMSEIFNDQKLRWQNSEIIDPFIERLCRGYTKDGIFREAQQRHIAASPLNTPAEFAQSDQARARGFLTTVHHPIAGAYPQTNPVFRFSASPGFVLRRAPTLGEHNTEVFCGELRLSHAELKTLQSEGIV